jgi:PAS domain S-box-containing protein
MSDQPIANDSNLETLQQLVAEQTAELKELREALQRQKHDLEFKYKKRTDKLKIANQQLREEIIDRWRTEEALRESQQQLELFFSQSLDGFFFMMLDEPVQWDDTVDKEKVLDYVFANGRVTKANDALIAQYGATREEFIGLTLTSLLSHNLAGGREAIGQLFEAGRIHIETDDRKFDGTQMWIEGDYICIYDLQGRIIGHFGVQRDISDRKQVQKELQDAKQMYQQILDAITDMILVKGPQSRIIWANKAFRDYYQMENQELVGIVDTQFQEPSYIQQYILDDAKVFNTGETWKISEEPHLDYEGNIKYFDTIKSPIFNTEGQVVMTVGVSRDTTKRKQAEKALRESEECFRQLAENIQDSFWLLCTELNGILYISPAYEQIWGRSIAELYANSQNWIEWVHSEDRHILLEGHPRVLAGESTNCEYRILRPDGTIRWVCDRAFPIHDESGKVYRIAGICEDISDRKFTEARIQAALHEKEILVKEIHHRVKNNMQVISSLLQLQAQYIEDEATLSLFEESQTRIHSMALIHEQLYQSENLDRIDLLPYVENLVANLYQSFGCYNGAIQLNLNVDQISLNIETAIPCGLIINELVSNSLKYAFSQKGGEISIDFHQINPQQFHLRIKDNGVGFPVDFDVENTETLGLRLVRMLVHQLEGSLAIDSQCGTCYDVNFSELNYRRRI